jgi:surface antigen
MPPTSASLTSTASARDALEAALAGLDLSWSVLGGLAFGGPPDEVTVDFIALHPQRGVALIDAAPGGSRESVPRFGALLQSHRFSARFPGTMPIVHLSLTAAAAAEIDVQLDTAFARAPALTIRDPRWVPALAELLTSEPEPVPAPAPPRSAATAMPPRLGPALESEPVGAAFARAAEQAPRPRTRPSLRPGPRRTGALAAAIALLLGVAAGATTVQWTGKADLLAWLNPPPEDGGISLVESDAATAAGTTQDAAAGAAVATAPPPPAVTRSPEPTHPTQTAARPPDPPTPARTEPSPRDAAAPASTKPAPREPAPAAAPPASVAVAPLPAPTAPTPAAKPPEPPKPVAAAEPPPIPAPKPELAPEPPPPPRATASAPEPAPRPVAKAPEPAPKPAPALRTQTAVRPPEPPAGARAEPAPAPQRETASRGSGPIPLRAGSSIPRGGPPLDATDLPPIEGAGPRAADTARQDARGRWEPPRAATTGVGASTPAAADAGQAECRPYVADTTITGAARPVAGLACRQADGRWKLVTERPTQ